MDGVSSVYHTVSFYYSFAAFFTGSTGGNTVVQGGKVSYIFSYQFCKFKELEFSYNS